MKKESLFFLEARIIKDDIFRKGDIISDNEGFKDHYRRFLDFGQIVQDLENVGFEIIYKIESKGLAIYKDENPAIIRIIARV